MAVVCRLSVKCKGDPTVPYFLSANSLVAGCAEHLASRRSGLAADADCCTTVEAPTSVKRTMSHNKKTKIFCTMGPACWDVPTITSLIDAGMNTARLNFSHGDHAAHGATMDRVKEAAALRPGAPR